MVAQRRPEQLLVRRRMEAVFLGFLGFLTLIALRLTYIQIVQARGFGNIADRIQAKTLITEAVRGDLIDRNGNEMATNILAKTVMINPQVPKDADATAARIAEILHLDDAREREIADAIREADAKDKRYFLRIARGVDRKRAEGLLEASKKDKRLTGVWLENSPQRINPAGFDARQIIGSVNIDGIGIEGAEMFFNSVLQGTDGERTVRVDARGIPIPNSDTRIVEPVDGKDVTLTIDRDLQHIVESEMRQLQAAQSPDYAVGIVMDVKTGDVLATCSLPAFDPKEKEVKRSQEMRKCRAVTDIFEPGSIFKVITAAAAMELGVNTNTGCYGRRRIGRYSVGCAHGTTHGAVDMRKMVELSCNLAAGTYAERVGPQPFHEYIGKMGFLDKTGIEYPGEVRPWLAPPDKWRTLNTVNIGFGQGISVTPIQLLAAYAAVANDGVYNAPRLALDAPGMKLNERKSHRVMSARNAETLRSYMEGCVTNGTGKNAKIPGYSVGGKTGTAQISAGKRGYSGGYVSSFAGFVPAVKPRLAILVSAWRAKNGQYGGTVAAPVFREIARQCVAYMRIPPDQPEDTRDGAIPGSGRRRGGGGD